MIPSFFRLETCAVTESTNKDLIAAATAGQAEGLVLRAVQQTAGRGRQGRVWESPPGNLYTSLLLRPVLSPAVAQGYSFVTALAVFDTVQALLPGAPVLLKWPNDVLVGDKKISGILVEVGPHEGRGPVDWVVVGVGINVESHPDKAMYPTTSLWAEGAKGASPDTVLARFLESFYAWDQTLRDEGFTPIRLAWRDRARTGRIAARLQGEVIEGHFDCLDDAGRLVLRLDDGSARTIAAGDLFFPD